MGDMTTQPIDRAREAAPLLLTLLLAEPAQSVLQALRARHFPAMRNIVPAHVSLFHALPGNQLAPIERRLRGLDATAPAILVEPPRSLGRGVAFPLASPDLVVLRGRLADAWSEWLTPQDRERYRPHVTVQNKVTPEVARATLARLAEGFVPWPTEGAALLLWRYLGGPWESVARIPLAPAGASGTIALHEQPG